MIDKIASFFKRIAPSSPVLTVATFFTIIRIVIAPFIAAFIVAEAWYWAGSFFILAAISDFLDGFLARLRKEETVFGALLDPLADKALFILCFFALTSVWGVFALVPAWFAWFVLARELIIVVGTFVVLAWGRHVAIRPTIWGKLTTLLYMLLIVTLLLASFNGWVLPNMLGVFIGVTLFALYSLVHYIMLGISLIRN